ncbi:hypothetical protein [Streptomyces sp. NPDC058145]|uniref:hypothetical protein n=1 Tax=Streptomyces sp. NPDC058145 TaxID=3346356 RepID=UPI0036E908DB
MSASLPVSIEPTYGAGLLPLIDARNWRSDVDLAEVYAVCGIGARLLRAAESAGSSSSSASQ